MHLSARLWQLLIKEMRFFNTKPGYEGGARQATEPTDPTHPDPTRGVHHRGVEPAVSTTSGCTGTIQTSLPQGYALQEGGG